MPEYLTNGKFEQFEKRVFEKLDDIKDDQKELKETNIKNAPAIAFAAKAQSSLSKIVITAILALTTLFSATIYSKFTSESTVKEVKK